MGCIENRVRIGTEDFRGEQFPGIEGTVIHIRNPHLAQQKPESIIVNEDSATVIDGQGIGGEPVVVVVIGILYGCRAELLEVGKAGQTLGLAARLIQRGQQYGSQNRDDCYPLKFKLINFSAVFCLFCIIQDFDTNHYS